MAGGRWQAGDGRTVVNTSISKLNAAISLVNTIIPGFEKDENDGESGGSGSLAPTNNYW